MKAFYTLPVDMFLLSELTAFALGALAVWIWNELRGGGPPECGA